MHVLLLGATGNLGSRLIPALIAHGHKVIAYVRSPDKLQGLISPALYDQVTVYKGDAFYSSDVEHALTAHKCDALISAAGNQALPWQEQILGKLAASISAAAIRVGKARGAPLRAWFIGGLGSLEYPGTGGQKIEDFLPLWTSKHHRQIVDVLQAVPTTELKWTLLCVALMRPALRSIDVLEKPRGQRLSVSVHSPPEWQDSWVRSLPFIGEYVNLVVVAASYSTKLEDVADLIVENLMSGDNVGELVGIKDVGVQKAG